MKTTKLFFMAALALMTAACSNDDNDLTTQQPQKAEGITITAQLAPKTNGAATRAVTDQTTYIEAKWAVNEHIAILYTKDGNQMADATITAVDGTTGAATITFIVEDGTPDDTPCTLVYPLSAAKDDHSGVKDAATLLADQDGTLNANLDVRVGGGTIQTTTPGLTVTTQPAAQFAIFKFTVKNSDASATINVKPLTVTIGAQDYVITPAAATSELFVALPAVSGQTVSFSATGSDSKTYTCSKASVTFAAGNYYQSTLKMAAAATPLDITTTAWTAGSYAVPAGGLTYSDAITVSGDVTLTLTDGETLTLNKGISLASGATLTIQGNGTMNVNGTNENTTSTVAGSTGTLTLTSGTLTATGGNGGSGDFESHGGNGGDAINGSVIVSGGTLTATGGNGGSTPYGYYESHGGNGGDAISGSVTVSGGTLTARGGNGGSVGDFGTNCSGGKGGDAISGTLTINGGSTSVNDGSNGSIGSGCDSSTAGTGGKGHN